MQCRLKKKGLCNRFHLIAAALTMHAAMQFVTCVTGLAESQSYEFPHVSEVVPKTAFQTALPKSLTFRYLPFKCILSSWYHRADNTSSKVKRNQPPVSCHFNFKHLHCQLFRRLKWIMFSINLPLARLSYSRNCTTVTPLVRTDRPTPGRTTLTVDIQHMWSVIR
jgi:hypothetical protein